MVHIRSSIQNAEVRQLQRGHHGMRKMKGRKTENSGPLILIDQPVRGEARLEITRECVDTTLKPSSKARSTNSFKILFKNACALVFLPVHVCGTCTPGSQRPEVFRETLGIGVTGGSKLLKGC